MRLMHNVGIFVRFIVNLTREPEVEPLLSSVKLQPCNSVTTSSKVKSLSKVLNRLISFSFLFIAQK